MCVCECVFGMDEFNIAQVNYFLFNNGIRIILSQSLAEKKAPKKFTRNKHKENMKMIKNK